MDWKPADFFLTITSFFAILLPGALMALLLLASWPQLLPAVPAALPGGFGPWLVFLIAAYLAGQLLYAFGSWLLDPIHDWMKLGFKHPDRRGRFQTLEASLRENLFGGISGSVLPKARAYLLAHGPQAWIAVEQADADSKFFRAITIVAAWGVPAAIVADRPWQLAAAIVGTVLVIASSTVFRLVSCRASTAEAPPAPTRADGALESGGDSTASWLSRTWSRVDSSLCENCPGWMTFGYGVLSVCGLWLLGSVLFNLAASITGTRNAPQFGLTMAACWGLMLVSYFRYNVRRADRDKTALEAAKELADASRNG
jgi:hypothetical protein